MDTSSMKNETLACDIENKRGPLKRHSALKQFSRDHHFALLLIWKIRQGLKTGVTIERIARYLLFFYQQHLRAHFYEEEKMLFARLPEDDVMRKQAVDEHRRINLLIAFIGTDLSNTDLLTEFADLLEMHIRFEERSLFNRLQSVLSDSELKAILLTHEGGKGDIDKEWGDHFWNCK